LDLDVDGLLGALLLAEHAALPVAEEAQAAAGRRRRGGGRGGAQARGEGGQRGPHRHLVLSPRSTSLPGPEVRGLGCLSGLLFAGWVEKWEMGGWTEVLTCPAGITRVHEKGEEAFRKFRLALDFFFETKFCIKFSWRLPVAFSRCHLSR
jgi:hypothetical protein